MTDVEDTFRIGLVGLFIAALITAQFLAVKVIALPLPAPIPIVGDALLFPAGVIAIAVTFLATDCYTELYGERPARRLVNVGFLTLVVMLALLWVAIFAPGSDSGVEPDLFAAVLAPSTNIVAGGVLAYLVSQHWDVIAFHRIRRRTGPGLLWVRNLASTATSQLLDTVVFVLVAFWLAPVVAGLGPQLAAAELAALLLGHYLAKLGIAVLDTPFVYLLVGAARRRHVGDPATAVGE